MESLGWRQRRGSSPAARRGARQRAGLTPVAASNILSCGRRTKPAQADQISLTPITVSMGDLAGADGAAGARWGREGAAESAKRADDGRNEPYGLGLADE